MDMRSSERAYPTQQDLQVFLTLFKIAGSFGSWGFPALQIEIHRPAGLGGGLISVRCPLKTGAGFFFPASAEPDSGTRHGVNASARLFSFTQWPGVDFYLSFKYSAPR